MAHEECVNLLNKPSPCKHSLKIYARGSLDYIYEQCHILLLALFTRQYTHVAHSTIYTAFFSPVLLFFLVLYFIFVEGFSLYKKGDFGQWPNQLIMNSCLPADNPSCPPEQSSQQH